MPLPGVEPEPGEEPEPVDPEELPGNATQQFFAEPTAGSPNTPLLQSVPLVKVFSTFWVNEQFHARHPYGRCGKHAMCMT